MFDKSKMLIRITYLIALFGILILQSCSKDSEESEPKITYHQDGEVSRVMYNRADGLNIVILGDGFTKEQLITNGLYDSKVKEVTDFLFNVEPFKQYKKYFNVYQVYAESKVSGAADEYTPQRTKFDAFFGSLNDRYLVPGNYDTCYSYATKAVPLHKISVLVLMVNDERYGGTGGSIATLTTDGWSRFTLLHEVGHSFAGLADEYVEEAIADNYPLEMVPYLPNVDTTSDLTKVKWAHLLGYKGYKQKVGAFVGGYYRAEGIYRPEETSIMRQLDAERFNAPSREAIVRTIHAMMNIPFNLDSFITDDAKNLTPTRVSNTFQVPPPLRHDFVDMKQRTIQLHKLRRLGHLQK